MHLQKVVAGACYRKFDEVEADAAAAARWHAKRAEQAGGRHMVGFDALAVQWQVKRSDVLLDCGRLGHHTERRANASVFSRPK